MCWWLKGRLIPDQQRLDFPVTLQHELRWAHQSLQMAYNQFDQAVEEELIEASTYAIKAAQLRYNWLLAQAKGWWSEQDKEDRVCQQ